MRTAVSIALVLIVVMSGCLGLGDATDENWVIDAAQVNNTTGVPVHDVTREELARNEHVLNIVEKAYENGEGQSFLTQEEAEAAIEFLERYESFDPENHHENQPSGVYFTYRNETIVVEDAIHDVTQG